eukprot:m.115129 g.115129  ORF g.115129 m.115129 type:complete len:205 (+) comp17137_c0_seq4:1585-2199(+)
MPMEAPLKIMVTIACAVTLFYVYRCNRDPIIHCSLNGRVRRCYCAGISIGHRLRFVFVTPAHQVKTNTSCSHRTVLCADVVTTCRCRFRLQVVCSTSSAPTVAPTTTPSSSAPMPSDTTTPSSGASGMGSGGNDDGDAGLTWLWVVLPMMVFMGVIVGAMWYRQNALANPHQPSGASAEGHARGPGRSHAAENPVFRFNDDSVA